MTNFNLALKAGWITATLIDDKTEIVLHASYLSDAPRDLLKAIVALIRGSNKETFFWLEEPGQYGWMLSKDKDILNIKIYDYSNWLYDKWEENLNRGKLIFSSSYPLIAFAKLINKEFTNLLKQHGLEGYKKEWSMHEFPLKEKEELDKLLNK